MANGVNLSHFVAYALHRTNLQDSVTYLSLILLQRLKYRLPAAEGPSGHRLFISSFMVATKFLIDQDYTSRSWVVVAQGLFPLREINQMERELCDFLRWELTVDNQTITNFQKAVTRDFCQDRSSYPQYTLTFVSKHAAQTLVASSESLATTTSEKALRCQASPTSSSNASGIPFLSSIVDSDTSLTRPPNSPLTASTPVVLVSGGTQLYFTHTEEAPPTGLHSLTGKTFSFAVPSRF